MFQKNKFYRFLSLCFVLIFIINTLPSVHAELTEQEIETRINNYCENNLKINRTNFEYSGNQDFTKFSYQKIKTDYHEDINKLFANSIKQMLNMVENNQSLEQKCTNQSIAKKIQKGVTTYEIAQKALCRHALYKHSLNQKRNEVNNNIQSKDLQDVVKEISGEEQSKLQTQTYQALGIFQERIEIELEISQIALENTLAAYDEMLIMYPLHIRLTCIISDLKKFRDELADLVNIFYCLERFVNAASDRVN